MEELPKYRRVGVPFRPRPGWPVVALCECSCGVRKDVPVDEHGNPKSARCRNCGSKLARNLPHARAIIEAAATKHGHYKGGRASRTAKSWECAVARCTNEEHDSYPSYGGRGITITPRWTGPGGFERFFEDMGLRPVGMTLDRIDNDGNYEKSNCRWAPNEVQYRNKSNNVFFDIGGEKLTQAECSRRSGVSVALLRLRMHEDGLTMEQAMTKPVKKYRPRTQS